jgi:hypothetical protein
MKRGWKRVAAGFGLGAVVLAVSGMVAHRMMPHGHRPENSEFGFGPRRSAAGLYVATLEAQQPIEIRKMQTMRVIISDANGRPADGASLTVDGGMPEHGHGLPTQPKVTRSLGGGAYLVEGVKFNMGGWWTLTFQVDAAAGRDSVTFNLDL